MRTRLIALAVALAGAATAAAPVMAAQGCGGGFHRTYRGRCVPNRGYVRPGVVAPRVVLRIGGYYPGRGYWNGRRYYRHRYRHNGGWRYR